ncbi:YIP1 family protein [Leptolyngbya sp. FACHB-17]|uniref:YIP1 family protein n=1 Tax=unclassified Leptolyngbya TaxID=2650499 RepID=UPI0016803A30|nr:YIP1 family protein [Leptolyngbya sp. FACHB-17]MBD2082274.1 YIP1 family protein [Leptolyngbya sp. FACHB-17]
MNERATQAGIWQTIRAALTLNAQLYETAQNTSKTHRLAFTIVLLAALSRALGSAAILLLTRTTPFTFILVLLLNVLSVIASYYIWTFTIWKIGRWLKSDAPSYRALLSPIGFAYSPQILNFLTLIPLLGSAIEIILAVWTLMAVIVAVRQALDVSTRRAALICLLCFPIIQIAIGVIQAAQQLID